MPTYTFRNKTTGMEWDKSVRIKDLDEYKKENDCEVVIGTPAVVRGVGTLHSKVDGDFKSKLSKLKKEYPNSNGQLKDW